MQKEIFLQKLYKIKFFIEFILKKKYTVKALNNEHFGFDEFLHYEEVSAIQSQ